MKGESCRDPKEEADKRTGTAAITLEHSASADIEVDDGMVEVVDDQVDDGVADTDHDELATMWVDWDNNVCGFETNRCFQTGTEPPRCWLRGPGHARVLRGSWIRPGQASGPPTH